MPALPQSTIVGSWRVDRAEPPSTDDPTMERFLHFTADGLHYWEHPFATGPLPRLCLFRYHMTERGVFITPSAQQNGWELPFTSDGDRLIFAHGERRWWLKRISADERPDFLTHFYDAPAEPNVA